VATLIGALAGAVAVLERAGSLGSDPPPQIDARIMRVTSRDVAEPLRMYLSETSQAPRGYSTAQLDQRGYVFNVTVRIIGERGKTFPVRWTLYRRDPETRLEGRAYNPVAGDMSPASNDHRSTWPVWVPYPPSAGTYFVRFTLEDHRRRPSARRTPGRSVTRRGSDRDARVVAACASPSRPGASFAQTLLSVRRPAGTCAKPLQAGERLDASVGSARSRYGDTVRSRLVHRNLPAGYAMA
jgi:hypothetical protein